MKRSARELEITMLAPRRRAKGTDDRHSDHPLSRIRCTCGTTRPTKPSELRGTVLWFTLEICGQRYEVWVDREYHPLKLEGACTWTENRIDVLEQSYDRMLDTLIHEVLHAMTDASALKWTIHELFPKLSLQERRRLDEAFCRFAAPAMLSCFRSAGMLNPPAWPPSDGSRVNKRRARAK